MKGICDFLETSKSHDVSPFYKVWGNLRQEGMSTEHQQRLEQSATINCIVSSCSVYHIKTNKIPVINLEYILLRYTLF